MKTYNLSKSVVFGVVAVVVLVLVTNLFFSSAKAEPVEVPNSFGSSQQVEHTFGK